MRSDGTAIPEKERLVPSFFGIYKKSGNEQRRMP